MHFKYCHQKQREGAGVGCHRYGYFILGYFVAGHMKCMDETQLDKMPVKIAREVKMLAILWDREDKMPILSKH